MWDTGSWHALAVFPASEIVEAQWAAERRGLERFRTEQPPYSIVNRSIEREILPVCQRYGMGTLVWSPLGQGLLTAGTARARRPAPTDPAACRSTSAASASSMWSNSSSRSPRRPACR